MEPTNDKGLTSYEKDRFDSLLEAWKSDDPFIKVALMRSYLDGVPKAAICAVFENEDDFEIFPVAILLTDEECDRILDSDYEATIRPTETRIEDLKGLMTDG